VVSRGEAVAGAVAAAGSNELHPSRCSPVLEMGGASSVSLRGTLFRRASIRLILSGAKTSGRGCHGDLDWLHRRYWKGFGVFVAVFRGKIGSNLLYITGCSP
jgi:hypothetical protein